MILNVDTYLTSDRALVVYEGDSRAAFLLGRAGMPIPDAVAKKYGLLEQPAETAVETRDPEPEHRVSTVLRKIKSKIKK